MKSSQTVMLGVGDYGFSLTPGEIVKTMSLGSCVAVVLLDPSIRCVGMVHVALPNSSTNTNRSKSLPGYFADTGIQALLNAMWEVGANRLTDKWLVKLIGGANVADQSNTFNIGKRNVVAIKKELWKHKMAPKAEDTGENYSRTVSVEVANGRITISSPHRGQWQI